MVADCPECGERLRAGPVDPPGPHGRPELNCPECGNIYRWLDDLELVSRKSEAD